MSKVSFHDGYPKHTLMYTWSMNLIFIQSSTSLCTTHLWTDRQLMHQFLDVKMTTHLGTKQNLLDVSKSGTFLHFHLTVSQFIFKLNVKLYFICRLRLKICTLTPMTMNHWLNRKMPMIPQMWSDRVWRKWNYSCSSTASWSSKQKKENSQQSLIFCEKANK